MAKNNQTTLPFVKTSDEETMKILEAEGFELIDYSNGIWTFLNNAKINKTSYGENKIAFSNTLCI